MSEDLHSRTIVPMKGKSGDLPRGDDWVYELKWDGMRVLAFVGHDRVRLQSSNGRDVTASFPELQALASLGDTFETLVLDGEIVAFAETGKPSFNRLQHRMHVSDPAEATRRSRQTPVLFVAFDLVHLNGHDLFQLPLENRRTLLEQISDDDPCWTICDQHDDDVDALLDVVIENRLEGVMAKRRGSRYEPGRRSADWVKIKPRLRQEFVVGGWLSGSGSRAGGLGSLLVGYFEDGVFRYAGRAGSGLTQATQREWLDLLTDTPTCPFAEAPTFERTKVVHWSKPEHVVEIAFAEWAETSQHLRHPVVLGRRADKDPHAVVLEV